MSEVLNANAKWKFVESVSSSHFLFFLQMQIWRLLNPADKFNNIMTSSLTKEEKKEKDFEEWYFSALSTHNLWPEHSFNTVFPAMQAGLMLV